jgi:integrase
MTTGMRRGEVLGLRWEDVDLEARRLSIVRTLVASDGDIRTETPKTDRSAKNFS